MSNRRHRARRPTRAARIRQDAHYGVAIGWARGAEQEAEAKQNTHDQVIEQMGDRRVGPVQWRIARDRDDALDVLRLMEMDSSLGHDLESIQECRRLLNLYGGMIVLALAEGRPERTH